MCYTKRKKFDYLPVARFFQWRGDRLTFKRGTFYCFLQYIWNDNKVGVFGTVITREIRRRKYLLYILQQWNVNYVCHKFLHAPSNFLQSLLVDAVNPHIWYLVHNVLLHLCFSNYGLTGPQMKFWRTFCW